MMDDYTINGGLEGTVNEVPFEFPEAVAMGFLNLRGHHVQRVQHKNDLGVFKDQKESQ